MDVIKDLKFEDLQVIGQSADRSIIFCYNKRKRRLLCFDQHAADERIRYEYLLTNRLKLRLEILIRQCDIEELKTQACRGAVKFGDKLTLDQCKTLIYRLLKCRMPFLCAHSRLGVCVFKNMDQILEHNQLTP